MPDKPITKRSFHLIVLPFILMLNSGCWPSSTPNPTLVYPGVTRITEMTKFSLHNPAWSPDGLRLAATSEYGGGELMLRREVYTIDVVAGQLSQVSNAERNANNHTPSWSPDGKRIVINSDEITPRGIGILDLESGEMSYLCDGMEAEWGPDEERIAISGPPLFEFVRGNAQVFGISILDLETGLSRSVFSVSTHIRPGGMDWSRDGSRIAFSFEPYDASSDDFNRDIYAIDTDGSGAIPVIASEEDETSPTWSPDGRMLAYTKGPFYLERYLWVANADGTCPIQLLDVEGVLEPDWSPDGKQIAFQYKYDLYLLDLTEESMAERLKGLDCP